MYRVILLLGVLLATGPVSAAGVAASHGVADVDAARIIHADREPGNWLSHGRTYSEQHFSPLRQINDHNAGRLGLAWYTDMPTTNGLEVIPLVVDGIMYTTGNWNVIHALDATTGRELWRYDPHTRRDWIRYSCCGPVNRGLAVWKGRLYEGILDGRLIAVDAATGKLDWEVRTTPKDEPYSITGAPRVVDGKVVIGNGGAELGVRGYVTAYDAETGKQIWRFYTVPGNPADGFESRAMAMAAKTWHGKWWKYGGGGTPWDSFAYDPDLNLLYIGTGNGGPWPRAIRSPGGGDNLFLSSIVAVNADTGKYVWHYQTTPGDRWDYTATQPMILADLRIHGKLRKVIMQAPKNGFFYVLDRKTGKLISAKNFVPVNWATGIDMKTGRPRENPARQYGVRAKLVSPGPNGGHDWQAMSYSPDTGLAYLPTNNMPWAYSRDPHFRFKPMGWNIGNNPHAAPPPGADKAPLDGSLLAWDPVHQKKVWQVDLGHPWNGGTLATAGNLVVEGAADGRFAIYRADTGKRLWQQDIHTGALAGPVTYTVNGEQYIAVAAGWGGSVVLMGDHFLPVHRATSRVLAFKLGGHASLPAPPPAAPVPQPPPFTASNKTADRGGKLYGAYCSNCHGFNAVSGGTIPDLRHMTPAIHDRFKDIVLGGALASYGMDSFADVLGKADAEAIHAWLIRRANQDYRKTAGR